MLEVGDDNLVYWEDCGNPRGKLAVVLHGGPGSGCSAWHRRLFDPTAYRIVLFDQRGCGRSAPHASDPRTDLASNNTQNLIADIERLRRHLGIERWMVFGGSWGSTLALVYAETHPERVTEIVLWGVTTGRHREFDWWFRGGGAVLFPEQWDRLLSAIPAAERDGDIVQAYCGRLSSSDSKVRREAATAWCRWESTTLAWPPTHELSPRFTDPSFAMAYARLVTHYVAHNAWLEDGILLQNAPSIGNIPGAMVCGRFDLQAPIAWAWDLKRVWPRAELLVVAEAEHNLFDAAISRELVRVTNRYV